MSRYAPYVIVVVSVLGARSVAGGQTLFEDDFSVDLSQWTIVSEGDNTYYWERVLTDGNPAPSLFLDDLASHHCFANSTQTFSYVGGSLEVSVDLKHGNAASGLQRHATFRLTGPDGLYDHDLIIVGMGVHASTNPAYPNTVNCTLRYDDNGVDAWESSGFLAIPNGDGWHTGRLSIQPDGIVDFYLDGVLVYTSVHSIIPRFDGEAVVQVGSRKSFYDNVRVTLGNNTAVPAVSEWGMLVMVLLLLTGLKLKFGRRTAQVAEAS